MKRQLLKMSFLVAFLAMVLNVNQPIAEAQTAPDTILHGGKILTVDKDFNTAQAIALTGNKISAVGSDEDVKKLAGPNTKLLDLAGKTVIPGLIDNHNHLIFNAPTWASGVRLENTTTRKEALQKISDKAKELGPGKTVYAFGGWTPDQFKDDNKSFSASELDVVAPENPVYAQISWFQANLNSKAMKLASLNKDTPDPGKLGKIIRDKEGNPTGRFLGPRFLKWKVRPRFPELTNLNANQLITNLSAMIDDYSKIGVTTSVAFNGPEFPEALLDAVKTELADKNKLKMRIYYPPHFGRNVSAMNPKETPNIVSGLKSQKPFVGTEMFQMNTFGEHVYLPISDSLRFGRKPYKEEQWAEFKKIVMAAASNGWQVREHVSRDSVMNKMIDIFEEVDKTYPIKNLRWGFEHADAISSKTIERAKKLGMIVAVHSKWALWAPRMRRNPKQKSYVENKKLAPLRMLQDSGIVWGLGSDGQVVAYDSPFFTLQWAVTGQDVTGQMFLDGKLTRKEALIAHTKNNAIIITRKRHLVHLRSENSQIFWFWIEII